MTQKLKKHVMKMQVQVICYEIDALFLQLNPLRKLEDFFDVISPREEES